MEDSIIELVKTHRLPPSFIETVERWYTPIAADISLLANASPNTVVIGVQGCQGSGKSTLSDFLKHLLACRYGLQCAVLSIDDFYLTKAERNTLSEKVHPLFCTRGVPGTHDTVLAINTIDALRELNSYKSFAIPRFNKAIDDRHPKNEWDSVSGPIDVIILEGWCVGLDPQSNSALSTDTNTLEKEEDPTGAWRSYVNQCLTNEYQTLFSKIDYTVMLAPPSFKCVFDWRLLQEEKLKEKIISQGNDDANTGVMSPEQVKRFISHYQRLTEHALKNMPAKAHWLLRLLEDHSIARLDKSVELEKTLERELKSKQSTTLDPTI